MALKSTIVRKTKGLYRGKRPLVLIVPPECDFISIRELHSRKSFSIDLVSVYEMAVKKEVWK